MTLFNNLTNKSMCDNNMLKMPLVRQRGFSLFITLIALLVMSLAATALIRSVDTNTVIAGNLAFKQTATASADRAVEVAIAWLEANNNGTTLNNSVLAQGYVASTTNATADPIGVAYWDSVAASACLISTTGDCVTGSGTAGKDAAGNEGAYIIQRLCANNGAPTGASCIASAGSINSPGGSIGTTKVVNTVSATQIYYRILVKVTGPRNTASYVQAIVTM